MGLEPESDKLSGGSLRISIQSRRCRAGKSCGSVIAKLVTGDEPWVMAWATGPSVERTGLGAEGVDHPQSIQVRVVLEILG